VRNTVEERIIRLQDKKRLVFESTIGGDAGSLAQLTEEDLRFLFQN
jgi:DNA repair protein RAD16